MGIENTFTANESNICPGTNSSGPWLEVGLTKSSPSRIISSGAIPVAVVYVKLPPSRIVSYSFSSGKKLPSLVLLRNITVSPSSMLRGVELVKLGNSILNLSGYSVLLVIPVPTMVDITTQSCGNFLPLGCVVEPSYKSK